MSRWAKLTVKGSPAEFWVNLDNAFAMMALDPGPGTRLWSGDVAAVSQPRVKSADPSFLTLPFHVDVEEGVAEVAARAAS